MSLSTTILLAHVLVALWFATFHLQLAEPEPELGALSLAVNDADPEDHAATAGHVDTSTDAVGDSPAKIVGDRNEAWAGLSSQERFRCVLALWPYIVPLILVYFAEYAAQAGAWAAVGFPVSESSARAKFYLFANWAYQAGVFVSRSSGTVYQASLRVLWVLPAVQTALLVFFCANAILHIWWDWSLLVLCFVTGLIGGAVYVNAFTLIKLTIPTALVELALSSASVGDSLGIMLSDASSIFIQACLYRWNGVVGEHVYYSCECCATPRWNNSNSSAGLLAL